MAAAATAESSRSGSSAGDSYIGSLISLTSKCEIRYEGVLYDINTQESSIGLRNVRSFGTEGRNKDGPQIPASEKVYEYILFRGSDIKDLQVKSSPPAQNASIHNDPAIIQSHYSHPSPPSTSFHSAASGTTPDLSSHTSHLGLPRMPFQRNMPLYQPAGSLGSWGSSPALPTANGSGLAVPGPMPMYWPGYYATTGSFPPHLQQPPLMRPLPGLSIPQSMQQPLPYSGVSTSLPSGSQNLQEIPSPLLPTFSSTLGSTSATTVPSTSASTLASLLAPEVSSCQMPTKPNVTSLHAAALGANLSFMPQFASSLESVASLSSNVPAIISSNPNLVPVSNMSHQTVPRHVSSISGSTSSNQTETSSANTPFLSQLASNSEHVASVSQNMPTSFSSNPRAVPISNVNYQTMAQSVPSNVGPPNSSQVERSVPLVTPDQLQPASSAVSSQPLQTSIKDVDVKPQESKNKPLLPEPSVPAPVETKEPILPLPTPTRQKPNGAVLHTHDISRGSGRGRGHEPNGAVLHTHDISRGRGRGRGHGYPRPMTKFTEDFDFTAMNEKFNKDEVWSHLGKNKAQLSDTDGDIEEEYEILDDDGDEPSKSDSKPIYVKDNFFDTLSCDALDRGQWNGRPRFSEQLKIDAETFDDFSRHRGARGGGRGFRGGRGRGSYYGRGYGYSGRGRGQSAPYRPF